MVIKNNLQNVAGSLKTKIPNSTVPTAPIPVQTAYAVPIGNSCVALTNKNMLIVRQTTNPMYQYVISVPVVSLAFPRQAANATSKSPAIINSIQFIGCIVMLAFVFCIQVDPTIKPKVPVF